MTEVVPSPTFPSEVNEDGEFHFEISCGSGGVVRHDPERTQPMCGQEEFMIGF